jgi:hypothetical protein
LTSADRTAAGVPRLRNVSFDVSAVVDSAHARVPVGAAVAAVTPGAHRQAAGKVTVPVFLAFGEVDVATAPHTEAAAYTSSDDVRLLVLRGSAHCHNTATTRQILWDRLADWIAETGDRQVPTRGVNLGWNCSNWTALPERSPPGGLPAPLTTHSVASGRFVLPPTFDGLERGKRTPVPRVREAACRSTIPSCGSGVALRPV